MNMHTHLFCFSIYVSVYSFLMHTCSSFRIDNPGETDLLTWVQYLHTVLFPLASQKPVKTRFFKITQVSAFLSHSLQCGYVINSPVAFWVPPHPGLIFLFIFRGGNAKDDYGSRNQSTIRRGYQKELFPLHRCYPVPISPLLSITLPFSPCRRPISLDFGFSFLYLLWTNEQMHIHFLISFLLIWREDHRNTILYNILLFHLIVCTVQHVLKLSSQMKLGERFWNCGKMWYMMTLAKPPRTQ